MKTEKEIKHLINRHEKQIKIMKKEIKFNGSNPLREGTIGCSTIIINTLQWVLQPSLDQPASEVYNEKHKQKANELGKSLKEALREGRE